MSKLSRHGLILSLVEKQNLASQDDLRRVLIKHGFKVTQATLSRDIHELGLIKSAEGYALPAAESHAEHTLPSAHRLVREFVLQAIEAQNLVVVKTSVGSAQPVAAALDSEGWPEMLGCIAGDDTILIICKDKKEAHRLALRIQEMLA